VVERFVSPPSMGTTSVWTRDPRGRSETLQQERSKPIATIDPGGDAAQFIGDGSEWLTDAEPTGYMKFLSSEAGNGYWRTDHTPRTLTVGEFKVMLFAAASQKRYEQ
jgi:hypothetical protein